MIEFINENGIITPDAQKIGIPTAVTTFSDHLFGELEKYGLEKICSLPGCMEVPVYRTEHNGKKLIVYRSPVGAPAAVAAAEEVMATGVKNIVAFGICGALEDIATRKLVVPTRAFRDEGTSYHYKERAEFVELKGAERVERHLTACGIEYVSGGTWTTDGFYRETPSRMRAMKERGCVAVDMECSALECAARFRGKNFYTFFITADSLAGGKWEPNYILDAKATAVESVAAAAAVKLAIEL